MPSVAEAPSLRPTGTAAAKINQEECQLSRESQRVPTAEGASGSNVEEIRSVFWVGGRARVVCGVTPQSHHPSLLSEYPVSHAHLSLNEQRSTFLPLGILKIWRL